MISNCTHDKSSFPFGAWLEKFVDKGIVTIDKSLTFLHMYIIRYGRNRKISTVTTVLLHGILYGVIVQGGN